MPGLVSFATAFATAFFGETSSKKRKRDEIDDPACSICYEEGDIQCIPCGTKHSVGMCKGCTKKIVSKYKKCLLCKEPFLFHIPPKKLQESNYDYWNRLVKVGNNFYMTASGTIRFRDFSTNSDIEIPFSSRSIKRYKQYPNGPYLLQIDDIHFTDVGSVINITELQKTNYVNYGGCFTADCIATILNNQKESKIRLDEVRPGDFIKVEDGSFKTVKRVMLSEYIGNIYTLPNGLRGTPWHPVFHEAIKKWVFFKDYPGASAKPFNGYVYSLQFDKDVTRGVLLCDISCAVLGHGVTLKTDDPILGHAFFGDWKTIDENLSNTRVDEFDRNVVTGFTRNPESREVNGLF
jgi:hypothetical protein